MSSTINASNGTVSGLISTGDASGELQLQVNNGTPAVTLNTSGAVGVGSTPGYGSSGQVLTSAGSGSAPTWAAVAVPSGATLTNPTITNYTETLYSATGSTAISLSNGTEQKITTSGTTTITLPSSVSGKSFTVIVAYAAADALVWAGGSTLKWAGGVTPTATSSAGKFDIFNFYQDGTNTYGSIFGQNY